MESFMQNVMHASLQCHANSLKEGSFGNKKGSVPFKNSLETTLVSACVYTYSVWRDGRESQVHCMVNNNLQSPLLISIDIIYW